jgi:arabinose-5-phosphate isomerase
VPDQPPSKGRLPCWLPTLYDSSMLQETARKVLEIESQAILDLRDRLDARFDRAVEILFGCPGRIIATGMGKSGIIAQKVSATLSSTGTPSLFLHPAEAIHGDLGRIVKNDVVLALSSSGETDEIVSLVPYLKRLGSPLVALTGAPASSLATVADVNLDVSIREEACPLGLAPTASTTAALAMGDALAMALLERRGFTVDDFAVLHPGGRIGKRLMRVEDLMQTGDNIPRVLAPTTMKEVLFEMTRKRLGMTTVVDGAGNLLGLISDGDLRRQIERHGYTLLDRTAGECMTVSPVTIGRRDLATHALDVLERSRITSLVVVDPIGRVEGVIHLHDLWKTEMI